MVIVLQWWYGVGGESYVKAALVDTFSNSNPLCDDEEISPRSNGICSIVAFYKYQGAFSCCHGPCGNTVQLEGTFFLFPLSGSK